MFYRYPKLLKCFCYCKFPRHELNSHKDKSDSKFESKVATLKICEALVEDSIELQNHVENAMDTKIIRHLLIKSRHR